MPQWHTYKMMNREKLCKRLSNMEFEKQYFRVKQNKLHITLASLSHSCSLRLHHSFELFAWFYHTLIDYLRPRRANLYVVHWKSSQQWHTNKRHVVELKKGPVKDTVIAALLFSIKLSGSVRSCAISNQIAKKCLPLLVPSLTAIH